MSNTAQPRKFPASEYVTFTLLSVARLFGAVFASSMGRFLSYAGTVTTRSASKFNAGMGFVVGGPFVIFAGVLLLGWMFYARGLRAWFLPLLGIIALIINFYAVAAFLGG